MGKLIENVFKSVLWMIQPKKKSMKVHCTSSVGKMYSEIKLMIHVIVFCIAILKKIALFLCQEALVSLFIVQKNPQDYDMAIKIPRCVGILMLHPNH